VRKGGLEPPCLSAPPPQDGVSANFTTSAHTSGCRRIPDSKQNQRQNKYSKGNHTRRNENGWDVNAVITGIVKEKISITLSKDVLMQLDRAAGSKCSRSALVDRVLRKYLEERVRAALNARDLARINAAADQLNAEAEDVLSCQAPFSSSRSSRTMLDRGSRRRPTPHRLRSLTSGRWRSPVCSCHRTEFAGCRRIPCQRLSQLRAG